MDFDMEALRVIFFFLTLTVPTISYEEKKVILHRDLNGYEQKFYYFIFLSVFSQFEGCLTWVYCLYSIASITHEIKTQIKLFKLYFKEVSSIPFLAYLFIHGEQTLKWYSWLCFLSGLPPRVIRKNLRATVA